jgi:urease accessory protein
MNAVTTLLGQRGRGRVDLSVTPAGVAVLREDGSAKVRLPAGGHTAYLLNTGGGLAGGDRLDFALEARQGARLTVTSQACERIYRSIGPEAAVSVSLRAGPGAALHWLPQETILYEGSALRRRFTAHVAANARFLAAEAIVLGRTEMGENPLSLRLRDHWRVYRDGRLAHADEFAIDGKPPAGRAGLDGARGFAAILAFGSEFEERLARLREALGGSGGASAWNGKVIARVLAKDGLELRQRLKAALDALAAGDLPPNLWIG